jgi:hypothetical protein
MALAVPERQSRRAAMNLFYLGLSLAHVTADQPKNFEKLIFQQLQASYSI